MCDLLVIAVVSEAHKGELVAHKGLGYRKGLLLSSVFFNVIEVAGVNVTAQFRHNRSSRCTRVPGHSNLMRTVVPLPT